MATSTVVPPTRLEWLEQRRLGIGGSDVHHLFGLEPFGCSRQLWYDKRGFDPDNPEQENEILKRGQRLEALIREEYAEKTGNTVTTHGAIEHPDRAYMRVNLDGTIISPSHPEPGVLECKTAGRGAYYEFVREGLPERYLLQVQHAMYVTGRTWGAFAVLWPDAWRLHHWEFERDDETITEIVAAADEFWPKVENGPAPERFDVTDARCHKCPYQMKCQGEYLAGLIVAGKGEEKDPTLAPLVAEWARTKEAVEVAEEEHDGVKAELRLKLGDRQLVQTPLGKVLFSPNREWDVSALERDKPDVMQACPKKYELSWLTKNHPELEKEYKRAGKTRPLRVYPR